MKNVSGESFQEKELIKIVNCSLLLQRCSVPHLDRGDFDGRVSAMVSNILLGDVYDESFHLHWQRSDMKRGGR